MHELRLAETPAERSALRSQVFLRGVEEMTKIGREKKENLNLGLIFTPLDAIHTALGKSERDFVRQDPKVVTLISSAIAEALSVRVTSPAHAFQLAKLHIADQATILNKSASDRQKTELCVRRIAAKLTNGHAGTWI